FFYSGEHDTYRAYCSDFGPVDLGMVVTFCRNLRDLLQDPRLAGRKVCYYTGPAAEDRTNAAFLLAAYCVLEMDMTPAEAWAPLARIQPTPFKMFRDATHMESDFDLSVVDCLQGVKRGKDEGWVDLETFDVETFRDLDVKGVSVMCPKFVAFKGPVSGPNRPSHVYEPATYIEPFRHGGVSDVVRLNEASSYDAGVFAAAGMTHHDMEFPDCQAPPLPIVERFLKTADEARGVVAVHCLAGLGRTGTLIALWIMGKYGWGARETIAWLRLARPGSVIGEQQHFL
ncbi:dual specificity protein phosphatase, partial [Baffinella frigidus]